MNVPEWEDAATRRYNGHADPLDDFVFLFEPDSDDDIQWRQALQDVVDYVTRAN